MVVQYLSCHDKIPQTWCLNNKSLFSHSSGGRSRSKVKVAGMVSGEACSCLAGATCCCTLTGPVLCVHRAPGVSPSYCVDTGPDGLGPTLMASFNLITSLEALSPNPVTAGVRASH